LRTEIAKEAGLRDTLANARRKFESDTLSSAEEMKRLVARSAYLDRMLQIKRDQLALIKGQAERAKQLNQQGLTSLDEKSWTEYRVAQTSMELEQSQTDRRENLSAIEKMRLAEASR